MVVVVITGEGESVEGEGNSDGTGRVKQRYGTGWRLQSGLATRACEEGGVRLASLWIQLNMGREFQESSDLT